MQTAFSVNEVHAGYGRIEVLHGVSIQVEDGASVGLFGPNGHGKSTLLRAISGLVPVTSGEVVFEGVDLTNVSSNSIVSHGIVHVPQGSTILPRMTVLEALYLGAFNSRAWPQRKDTLAEVFAIFPRLAERRSQNCNTLSGGERQMAAIGVGLMGRPTLLMLDEPSLGLAPRVRDDLGRQVQEISRTGVSLIVVDQDVELLLGLCPRLYLVEEGKVSLEVTDRSELAHRDVIERYFGTGA